MHSSAVKILGEIGDEQQPRWRRVRVVPAHSHGRKGNGSRFGNPENSRDRNSRAEINSVHLGGTAEVLLGCSEVHAESLTDR